MIKYPIALPYFPREEISLILEKFGMILKGEEMLSMGKNVKRFESAFAEYVGSKYAIATNSCTGALEIAFRSIGIKCGDEVIVPAETFIATGSAVVREGGKVVFAEINPETFCLSAYDLKQKITNSTKAVVIVHMAGLITPEIYDIKKVCSSHGLVLIEDAAHAPGAAMDGKRAGTFGDIGCFSFYPTKVMTTAEGGMLVTNRPSLYERANSFRNRGLDMSSGTELYIRLGTNNRMTEFSAILGLSQLKYLDSFIEKRNTIASFYTESLLDITKRGFCKPLPSPPNVRHAYWRYIVVLDELIKRDKLKEIMLKDGIVIDWAYDPPLHLQPFFKNLYNIKEGHLPSTEKILRRFVCLPMHVGLTMDDAKYIMDSFKRHVEAFFG